MHEKTIITASVRPPRIVVAFPSTISGDDFRIILKFLGLIWGGKFSYIVPIDTIGDNSVGLSWISSYSPDIILCTDDSTKKLINDKINKYTDSPLRIARFVYPLLENFHINSESFLTWEPLWQSYAKDVNSMPDTRTKFQLVSTDDNIENRMFYDLSFGATEREQCEWLAKSLRAESVHVEDGGINEYIQLHKNEVNPFSYLDISGLQLTTLNSFGGPPTIFVLSRALFDYAWFWNNRFDFAAGGNNSLAIPVDVLDERDISISLVSWLIGEHSGRANYCQIKSISAPKEALHRLARKLRPRLKKYGYDHVDVCIESPLYVPQARVEHRKQDVEASWFDSQSFKFFPPVPSFADEIKSNSERWVVEVEGGRHLKGHVPPDVSDETNTRVLNAPSTVSPSFQFGGFGRRYSFGNISISCTKGKANKGVSLPSLSELLSPYLCSIGINEVFDEKRSCYEAVFNLFEDRRYFTECCKGIRYDIIASLWSDRRLPCENGDISLSKGCRIKQSDAPNPVSLGEIKGRSKIGKKYEKPFYESPYLNLIDDDIVLDVLRSRQGIDNGFYRRSTPKSYIAWLVEKKVVRRVFRYPMCTFCGCKSDWVGGIDLERPLSCSRCGGIIPFPDERFDIGYQMNPLVFRAFKEGVRPVALTLSILEDASGGGFMYLPGFKGVLNNDGIDIDIIAICNGKLVLCECKSMEGVLDSSGDWVKVKEQFEKVIAIGKLCKASSVVLSSLADSYPAMIERLVKSNSSINMKIVLLTKADLFRGHVQIKNDDGSERRGILDEVFLPKLAVKRKRKGRRQILYGWGARHSGE